MKDFIRTLVLKTNAVWPFSFLNRMPYYLGVRAFVQVCKDFPQIQNAYLRHGLLGSDWVPGISDIDLTVLFESGRTSEEEFNFATSFWRRVGHLKRFFPMLGEIEVIDSKQMSSWTRFTIRGKESDSWKPLLRMGNLPVNYMATGEEDFVNSFNYALFYYFNFFLKRFLTVEMNPVTIAQLQRISQRVTRCANMDAGFEKMKNPSAMLCALITLLDKRLETFVTPPGASIQTQRGPARRIPLRESESLAAALRPFDSLIQSIYLGEYRSTVVLSGSMNPRELEDCMEVLKGQLGQSTSLHVVTFRMFDYLLRYYDPFFYAHLMQNRALAFGSDVFEQIAAPTMGAFIRRLLDQTVTILTFPTSQAFVTCDDPAWYGGLEVDSWMERCLRLKLFLEHGLIPLTHSEWIRQTQNYYQSYLNDYRNLTESFSKSSLFTLFRRLTREIHCNLEQYAPDQDWLLRAHGSVRVSERL